MLHLFSAEDGRPVAKLKHGRQSRFSSFATNLNTGGRTAASVYRSEQGDAGYHINFWDTTSWKLTWVMGPLPSSSAPRIKLIADDLFAIYEYEISDGMYFGVSFYRPREPFPISQFPGWTYLFGGDQVVVDSGQIFNTRTGARLHPPNGRKYHPELARFAPDGRFLPGGIDTTTEKTLPATWRDFDQPPKNLMGLYIDEPKGGWVAVDEYSGPEPALYRLPRPDRLNIPPRLLDLWAQVAVRGHVDDEGAFVPWDETTWEKKRQELAASPAPDPGFPFPGYLAVDRSYWLRQEFENANDAEKPRLAKQLLDRANVAGDKAEAGRWIEVLASQLVDSLKTKPLLRADVEEHLRQDDSLTAEIRAAALLKAAQLVEDANDLNAASWPIAARPNAEKDEYRRALRWAEAAVRNQPRAAYCANTLGVLQYRNGLYRDAIATLMRSHEGYRKSEDGPQPSDLAFLAMAHHALGESVKAQDYLRQLTGLCDQPRWKEDREATGFLKEARQRLALPR